MKSILLSVQPKWVEKTLNGEKTIEIRKSAPKELPFKVYEYCTKGKDELVYFYNHKNYKTVTETSRWGQGQSINYGSSGNGKVVAEFVCSGVSEYITEFSKDDNDYQDIKQIWRDEDDMPGEISYATTIISSCYDNPNDCILLEKANMSFDDVRKYCNYKDTTIYGLHITDLKVYDEPLELGEFYTECPRLNPSWFIDCRRCNYWSESKDGCSINAAQAGFKRPITRPPQSWQYVRRR